MIWVPQSTRQKALDLVSVSLDKYTPGRLIAELATECKISRADAKEAVRCLVDMGDLAYVYQYGCSFLDKSIYRPNQISERVWLAPEGVRTNIGNDQVCVWLKHGGAFGTGQHPTTRLSIQAIDFLLRMRKNGDPENNKALLDIGTGSGVLAIVAVKLGIQEGIGLDVESISRQEASINVMLNGLSDRIRVSGMGLNEIDEKFGLIAANLRLPTLLEMMPSIQRLSRPEAGLVLSGIKNEEVSVLQRVCGEHGFQCVWELDENGWACRVYIKKGNRVGGEQGKK